MHLLFIIQVYLIQQQKWHTAEYNQELINIFEYKIYTFVINLSLSSHRPSHFIIQFIVTYTREERTKLLALLSRYCPFKLSVYITINLARTD